MFGPDAAIAIAIPTAPNATPTSVSSSVATIAKTTIPMSPSCSARFRPIRVSATCPQTGIATIRTSAIALRRRPISPGSKPRPAKYTDRNGKNDATIRPNVRNRPITAVAGEMAAAAGLLIRPSVATAADAAAVYSGFAKISPSRADPSRSGCRSPVSANPHAS